MTEFHQTGPEDASRLATEATEQAAAQAREFTERLTGAGRAFGQLALDTQERTVAGILDLQERAAEAAPSEWLKTTIGAQASFVREVNGAYVKAARSLLD